VTGNGHAGRPLRVAIVITRLEGGAGVLALRGASVLDPDRFRVTVITGSGGPLLAEASAAGLEVIIEPSLRTPIRPGSDLRALRRLSALIGSGRYDVVHTHTAKAGVLGRLAAHRAAVPRIVHTYHGFPFHEFQSSGRRGAYVAVERRLGRVTDVALCVGNGVAVEAVRRSLIAPERIRTIGVAVAAPAAAAHPRLASGGENASGGYWLPARDPQARERARRALGLPSDGPVVGVVGRLAYQKAPEDFLAALARLNRPDVTGVWVGSGELAGRMAELAGTQPAARLVLAGERADVPDILPAFDVFALPSRYEGLPTAIVEAMMCGVPVVASAVNAVGDVVVPGVTGLLVPPRRPDLLAGAIGHLLGSPEAAARMAENARAVLGDRFGMSVLADALSAAYTDPLGTAGPSVPGARPSRGPLPAARTRG
jgi:glycosyltransferase involved in cell wall biosynthesis